VKALFSAMTCLNMSASQKEKGMQTIISYSRTSRYVWESSRPFCR